MRSHCLFIVGLLAALSGCGGRSRSEAEFGNQAGSSHVGEAGSAGGPGAGGVGAGGVGAGGQPAECSSFVDAKPLSIPVLLRNDLTFPIYLGARMETCGAPPLFSVQDASGAALPEPNPCRTPCETLLAGNPVGGCLGICLVQTAVTLQPGEAVNTSWAGLFGVEDDVPSECVPKRADGVDYGTRCEYTQSIANGAYTFNAQAGTAIRCSVSPVSPNGCRGCDSDVDGLCKVSNAVVGGKVLNARAAVELDAHGRNAAVMLVFAE